ncbi:MAG: nucleotidyltransferase family protein [Clostridia bacterium]|nr:nucleotidyltransferase family protein [Clostridia bacterium]
MEQVVKVMMHIIKCVIQETPLDKEIKTVLTEDFLNEIYKVSFLHDMAHIISTTLDKYELLPEGEIAEKFREQELTAIYRYERLNFEYRKICETLENAEINFIPLKGAVLRELYPEPWMRTSCDIDILVRRDDLKKAESVLERELQYTKEYVGTHDITLRSVNGVSTELHYDLVEDNRAKDSPEVLKNIWESSHLKENYKYFHIMDKDMFYFYHIAHIAKHFEVGGCGIRPLLDLWLMDNKGNYWDTRSENLLKQGGLLKFSYAIRNLSDVWFSGKEHDEITLKLQQYILQGGVYGTEENHILMRTQKSGGRIRYILSRIFVPYVNLKYEFAILQKYRFLTPVFEVYRWILFILKGNKQSKIKRLNSIKYIPEAQKQNVADMLEKIGL